MDFPLFTIDDVYAWFADILPRLALGVLIFFLGYIIAKWAAKGVIKALRLRKIDQELIVLFEMLTRWSITIVAFYLAAEMVSPGRLTGLVAGLGIAGFALGFALQDVAKNFIAGILLLLQQPFEIGDAIEVGNFGGTVLDISLRSTEIRTFDGRYVTIPNGDVFVSPIVNFTQAPRRRVELTLGVGYDSDLDLVSRVAIDAIREIPGLLNDPAPFVTFGKFGGSAIEFSLFYWLDMEIVDLSEGQTRGFKALKDAFYQAGIEMPFPTQKILMDKN